MKTWQQREQFRLTAGLYTPPPWKDEAWYVGKIQAVWEFATDASSLAQQHFVFLSLKTPGCIAYTPNDEYGNRDRQIICSPAKYLLKFCPNITQEEIDDYTARVRVASAIERYSLATDANTIEQVYRYGPPSCMSGDKMDHISIHPARMYAACDLAVAYLSSTAGRIRSRAVVWPEKKRHTTFYGDKSLVLMLEDDGYTFGEFTGAQIHTAYDKDEEMYICPYVDGADTANFVDEDRLSLFAGNYGEWYCKNTERIGYLCSAEHNDDDDENEDDAGGDE